MIRLDSITKTFPGVKALDRVSFTIHAGEVQALCGENGAGKSTLMKVLSGIWPAGSYEGRILRGDEELRFQTVRDAAAAGIAIVHQELALLPEMSVIDNLFLGKELHRHGRLDTAAQRALAERHFGELGMALPLSALARELSVGQQQRLEIARALLAKPSVLVLDEPTSALPEDDAAHLLTFIRHLADQGTACIYISHRMEEVFRIADRITVLRDGRSIWTKLRDEVAPTEVIAAMVDRPPTDMYAHTPLTPGPELCRLQDLTVHRQGRPLLRIPQLVVRQGEIVGLAGMMGAGRTCLLRTLMGSLHHCQVSGTLNDEPLPAHPADAMRRGLFLIPEDRKLQALFLDESLTMNTTAATQPRFRRHLRMDNAAMRAATAERMAQFTVKAPGPQTIARTLSGGNQQKVLLCRAAEVSPRVLLLDEPTRGIDVGAKEAIYRQMEAWTRQGWGILWSSSELQELLGISDCLYVLADGELSASFGERPFSEPDIMTKAAGS